MKKFKLKRFLAATLAATMVLSTNAFATPITLTDSPEDVKTDTLDKNNGTDYFADENTNNWQDGSISEEVRVNVDRASFFTITIPKEIVLNGNNGTATYKVKCEGDLAGDQILSVVPDTSFILNEDGGKTTPVTVSQPDTDFTYVELNNNTEYDGFLSTPEISAGNWNGKFSFNINFKPYKLPEKGLLLEEYSWNEIAIISEAGLAADYFNVGDEKKITINSASNIQTLSNINESENYTLQIIGFNHDDKSDGSGKAGITFQFKEILNEKCYMNSSFTNIGGWEVSDMRTYINNNIYNTLPSDLKTIIKTVNKKSNIGGKDTTTIITTQDKLFLLCFEEVGIEPRDSTKGLGTKYDLFSNDTSRIKYDLNGFASIWWLRNSEYDINDFDKIDITGTWHQGDTYLTYGVAPVFCI